MNPTPDSAVDPGTPRTQPDAAVKLPDQPSTPPSGKSPATLIVNLTPQSGSGPRRARRVLGTQSKVQTLFDHLPQSVPPKVLFEQDHAGLDPIFFTLGLKYSGGLLLGSNTRCIALLGALRAFILAFTTPEGKDFRHDFAEALKPNLSFLRKCRPFAVAMDNALEAFQSRCRGSDSDGDLGERELKADWIEGLSDYEEGIKKAKEAIVEKARDKIRAGDTVLIYGYSEVVRDIILAVASAQDRVRFDLIIVSDRALEQEASGKGLEILSHFKGDMEESLSSLTFTSITGLSSVIRRVTKVFLGAHALLTNGGVLAHVGTSQIALMASAHNIPVLVCCETYKFCDKSPTDSFFHNELGTGFGEIRSRGPDGEDEAEVLADLLKEGLLLSPVIKYDVTPPELVTAVITDVDILPCTSVPVVLRVQENRQHPSSAHSQK